jgi:SAM-dependent methyltransferase
VSSVPPRIDPLASAFGGIAKVYDRARPDYSPEPIDWVWGEVGLGPDATVIDLAAGTGKLTRALSGRGADLIAVEPQAELRELIERTAVASVLDGTAESIPVADGAADAVFVGEAFHWFDGDRALPEIHRVLRPRGGLAIVWHDGTWDGTWSTDLFARIEQLPKPDVRPENRPYTQLWRQPFVRTELFDPLERRTFERRIQLEIGDAVELISSWSFVAARPPAERARLRQDLTDIFHSHLGNGLVEIPYHTSIDLTRSR